LPSRITTPCDSSKLKATIYHFGYLIGLIKISVVSPGNSTNTAPADV
jgi:hypothetical protein